MGSMECSKRIKIFVLTNCLFIVVAISSCVILTFGHHSFKLEYLVIDSFPKTITHLIKMECFFSEQLLFVGISHIIFITNFFRYNYNQNTNITNAHKHKVKSQKKKNKNNSILFYKLDTCFSHMQQDQMCFLYVKISVWKTKIQCKITVYKKNRSKNTIESNVPKKTKIQNENGNEL